MIFLILWLEVSETYISPFDVLKIPQGLLNLAAVSLFPSVLPNKLKELYCRFNYFK